VHCCGFATVDAAIVYWFGWHKFWIIIVVVDTGYKEQSKTKKPSICFLLVSYHNTPVISTQYLRASVVNSTKKLANEKWNALGGNKKWALGISLSYGRGKNTLVTFYTN